MNRLLSTAAILSVLAMPAMAVTSLSVDDTGVLQGNGGRVIISGSLTCTSGDSVYVGIDLQQGQGRTLASGSGGNSFVCAGGTMDYEIPVTSFSGRPFKTGRAAVSVNASSCGFVTCTQMSVSEEIRLRR